MKRYNFCYRKDGRAIINWEALDKKNDNVNFNLIFILGAPILCSPTVVYYTL